MNASGNNMQSVSERKLVIMVLANIKQYRVVFYEKLAERLLNNNVDLRVVYSDSSASEASKRDSTDLPLPLGVKVKRAYFFSDRMLFQALPLSLIFRADLVTIVQSNGYMMNYLLLLIRSLGWRKLAFWGHGYNHQGLANSLAERMKRWLATKVDWWFIYSEATSCYLAELGFSKDRMTVIENAIDTSAFAQSVTAVSNDEKLAQRQQLGFPDHACVALYCGSLYADKQLEFLIQVGDEIYQKHQNFRLIIIGDGPQKDWLSEAAESKGWLNYCGSQFGLNKARLFAVSDFFICPGAVGLAILDSFAAGLPFISSDYKGHGPEIAYLEHEINGLKLSFNRELFVESIGRIIWDKDFLALLRQGAQASGKRYSLENMVSNVADGVLSYLSNNDNANKAR